MKFLPALSLTLLLTALPALAVEQYRYKVLEQKPMARQLWTQGLEIVDGKLYVSSGYWGKSALLRYDFASGKLEKGTRLHPKLFAEGLTVFGDRVFQLSWKARVGIIYQRDELQFIESFTLPGEGWGMTHNGEELIYSDGTHRLHYLSPETLEITRSIDVTENGKPLPKLNELEWIDGKVWANVWNPHSIWETDRIVIIDPDTGEVTASIDMRNILPASERREDTKVLNGIARNPADGGIWVTGKRWPWLYRIELVPAASNDETR